MRAQSYSPLPHQCSHSKKLCALSCGVNREAREGKAELFKPPVLQWSFSDRRQRLSWCMSKEEKGIGSSSMQGIGSDAHHCCQTVPLCIASIPLLPLST